MVCGSRPGLKPPGYGTTPPKADCAADLAPLQVRRFVARPFMAGRFPTPLSLPEAIRVKVDIGSGNWYLTGVSPVFLGGRLAFRHVSNYHGINQAIRGRHWTRNLWQADGLFLYINVI